MGKSCNVLQIQLKLDSPGTVVPDHDPREYHGRMALASVTKRHAPKKSVPHLPSVAKPPVQASRTPLFLDEDPELETAIQQSLDQAEADALQQAIAVSKNEYITQSEASSSIVLPALSSHHIQSTTPDDSDDDLYVGVPSRLDTALAFANTSPTKRSISTAINAHGGGSVSGSRALSLPMKPSHAAVQPAGESSEDFEKDNNLANVPSHSRGPESKSLFSLQDTSTLLESDDDMEEVELRRPTLSQRTQEPFSSVIQDGVVDNMVPDFSASRPLSEQTSHFLPPMSIDDAGIVRESTLLDHGQLSSATSSASLPLPFIHTTIEEAPGDDEEFFSDWEESSSLVAGQSGVSDVKTHPSRTGVEDWDAAQEMDAAAEVSDFAQFVSQMKGQDLEAAQRDIDDEIRVLNKQKKVAMRDSEDITQQMVSQIMVRRPAVVFVMGFDMLFSQLMLGLFGIPYITAPMEAEAQCAALVSLGLVEGIITDDSDVFLFGGMRVFKNMFNQSKTVECFLLNDLARELGLERDKLVRLAYLLGSDYVDGLPGVGPVVAMELMKEFPGEDGLHKFKEWWQKVQNGKDLASDTKSKFRKRFVRLISFVSVVPTTQHIYSAQKKRFKDLYLPPDWPNPAVVSEQPDALLTTCIEVAFYSSEMRITIQQSMNLTSRLNGGFLILMRFKGKLAFILLSCGCVVRNTPQFPPRGTRLAARQS